MTHVCQVCFFVLQPFSCSNKKNKMKKPCTKVSSQKVMKTLPKGKGTLSKGSKGKGALSKGSKGKKALAKGSFDKSQKKKPTKKTLEQMGEVSLKERVEMATKGSATAEEACQKLRDSMTEKEKQSAWGKHQTFLKANPEEKEKMNSCPKRTKGWQPHCGFSKRRTPPSSLWCPKSAPAKP